MKAILFICVSLFTFSWSAQGNDIISMSSSASGEISITIKCENPGSPIYIELADTTLTYSPNSNTTLTCDPNGTDTIRIKASNVTYFYCGSSQLTYLDVSTCSKLEYLDCEYNLLETLDVSNNTKLTYLSCYANKLGSIDLSTNIGLTTLWCAGNSLTTLDLSKNVSLINLYCFSNKLTALNVSKNTALQILDCGNNLLPSLDVKANIQLQTLFCYLNILSQLDVSKNVQLQSIWCYNNELLALDVTKNLKLTELYCDNNKIQSIDLSKNKFLTNLNITANNFSFSTFPKEMLALNSFSYSNQANIDVPGTVDNRFDPGDIIDFRAHTFIKADNTTDTTKFVWYDKIDSVLPLSTSTYVVLEGDTGKFIFLKALDSVYCVLTNAAYPDVKIRTNYAFVGKKVGVEEAGMLNSISVFPVPSKDFITVKGIQTSRIKIFNLQGSLLKTIENYNGEKIDISSLKKGAYIIESNYKFAKIIKQ